MFRSLLDAERGIILHIDDVAVAAQPGETVAAVMMRQAEIWTRLSAISSGRRAPYCMMGVCFDCLAVVDGQASTQTCMMVVRDGMQVRRQRQQPDILS